MKNDQLLGFDVVVVGGGGAGLLAAIAAARRGRRVCVLEKEPVLGGTTALSVGSIMAAGTRLQRGLGVVDSPEEHAQDLKTVCDRLQLQDNPALRDIFTRHAGEAVDLLSSIGVVFADPLPQPPHRKPRLHQVIPGSRSYIHHLERHCRRLGVQLMLRTPVRRLLLEGGRVCGVEAQTPAGLRAVTASDGVILATGDIAGDPELMRRYAADVGQVQALNPACAGDGHRMAQEIGGRIVPRKDFTAAGLVHMRFQPPPARNMLQRLPPSAWLARLGKLALSHLPGPVMRPLILMFVTSALAPDRGVFEQGALLVNAKGQRFCDELGGPGIHDVGQQEAARASDPSRSPSVLLAEQPEGKAWLVFDQRVATRFSAWPHFISTAPGVAYAYLQDYRKARPDLFHQAATLSGLEAALGMPGGSLRETLGQANASQQDQRRLVQPPFYALGPLRAWTLVTPVGLAVDTRLRVLDEGGLPIPGLFAAGGVGQGGFTLTGHGHGLGWAFTSGMLAGRYAAGQGAA
jgi:fumarate reductase flavoprotein subunit